MSSENNNADAENKDVEERIDEVTSEGDGDGTSAAGPEQIDESDGPPPPVIDETLQGHIKSSGIEEIGDEEPLPLTRLPAADADASSALKKIQSPGLEEIAGDTEPQSHVLYDNINAVKEDQTSVDDANIQAPLHGAGVAERIYVQREEDSIIVPTREEIEDEQSRRRVREDTSSGRRHVLEQGQEPNESLPVVPEAYLVEVENSDHGVVIDAEPLLPWWKQRRTKILLSLICFVVMAAAIAVGVSFSLNKTVTEQVMVPLGPNAPSAQPTTASPSKKPSVGPSLSASPTFSPTTCVYKISSRRKKIHLDTVKPSKPEVAVDGRNLVVVVPDSDSPFLKILLYYLAKNGEWEIVDIFSEDGGSRYYPPVLSGNIALIRLPESLEDAGLAAMFVQNSFGSWEKRGKLPVPEDWEAGENVSGELAYAYRSVGRVVGLDGDLSCVGDWYQSTFIFRRKGDQWIRVEKLNFRANRCTVSRDIIAINTHENAVRLFKYDRDQDRVVSLQSPLFNAHPSFLSQNHLVYSNIYEPGLFIYHRSKASGVFTQLQHYTYSDFKDRMWESLDLWLAIDKDVMVVGGMNHTHILSDQSGYWEETFVIDEVYGGYHISGRSLLVSEGNELYSFNLEDCTQQRPTQLPSWSSAPTSCYSIRVTVVFASKYDVDGISWVLLKVDTMGDHDLIHSYAYTDEDYREHNPSHTEEMCVQGGEYEFTIYDSSGISIGDGGHYNVSTSSGAILAQGRDVYATRKQTTRFSIANTSSSPPSSTSTTSYIGVEG